MVVWRRAPSSLSRVPEFSCACDVSAGLQAGLWTDLLTVGTGSLQCQWLMPGWKLASPP